MNATDLISCYNEEKAEIKCKAFSDMCKYEKTDSELKPKGCARAPTEKLSPEVRRVLHDQVSTVIPRSFGFQVMANKENK